MECVLPSTTWPTLLSLVTGVRPDRHGLAGNHIVNGCAMAPGEAGPVRGGPFGPVAPQPTAPPRPRPRRTPFMPATLRSCAAGGEVQSMLATQEVLATDEALLGSLGFKRHRSSKAATIGA